MTAPANLNHALACVAAASLALDRSAELTYAEVGSIGNKQLRRLIEEASHALTIAARGIEAASSTRS